MICKKAVPYFLLILFFYSDTICAQSRTISGTITEAETGITLSGCNIVQQGTTNHAVSDGDGNYQISATGDSIVLVASFVGFNVQLRTVKSDTVNFEMKEAEWLLEEALVLAYNRLSPSERLSYSVQKLDNREIDAVKAPNFVDNLSGKLAGVNITQGASGVGSSSRISIRGENSFTNNDPLFVVDGVPINNTSAFNFTNAAAAGFQEVDFGNGAMEINSDDVESVTILKGPSAAAIYGSRAANGVVLLNLKRDTKLGVSGSFSSSVFIDRPFSLPKFQNKYGQGNSGEFEFVDGLGAGINDNITYSWGPELDAGITIPQFDSPVNLPSGETVRGGDVAVHGGATITPTEFQSQPNNLSDFYQTGVTTINTASLKYGGDQAKARISFSDLNSDSFIPGVNLDRQNAGLGFVFDPSNFKIDGSFNYIYSTSDNRPSSGYGSENINYSLVAWGPRSLNIESLKNYWQPGLEGLQQYSFNYTFFDNPYFILHENINAFDRDRIFGNIGIAYELATDFTLKFSSGVDYSSELRRFRRNYSTNRFRTGAYAEQEAQFREVNNTTTLQYDRQFKQTSVDVLLGINRMEQTVTSKQSQTLSLAQSGVFNFGNAAAPIEIFQNNRQKRINSLFAQVNWGFYDVLFIDFTARNDWSSALATPQSTANVSFLYPSVSLAYGFSEQLNLPEFISFAKLRAGWAQVGNDTDPYQTTAAFVSDVPYQSEPTFSAQDEIPNNNLLPEKTNAIELGLDLHLLDDRLRIDLTYYDSKTENQIISFPVPISSGYTERIVNGGAVRSKGWEIMADFYQRLGRDSWWKTRVNFSSNRSTVEELPEGADKITLAFSRVYDNENQTIWFQVEEGGEIGDMYGTGYLKNENGDFIINAAGQFIADNELKKLGNYNPDFVLGFSNAFGWKNWSLDFLLDWRKGGQILSRTLSLAGVAGQLEETLNRPEEGIIAEGVVNVGEEDDPVWEANATAVSAESYYRQYYDRNHEENNIYSASYLKLRQFSIGYNFYQGPNSNAFLGQTRLNISLIGRNIWAWSAIPHFDPEQFAVQGNQFISGVEDMSYPTARSLGVKVSLDF